MSRTSRIALACVVVSIGIVMLVGGERSTFVAPGQHDVISIDAVERGQSFYGRLDDFPHTYSFAVDASTAVSFQILVPDKDGVPTDVSGLMLEALPDDAGVREVKRLSANGASWEPERAWRTSAVFRAGPTFYDSLEPGQYLFEVSSPLNRGPYVLRVGTERENVGYFAAVRDMLRVHDVFGSSRIAALMSPLIFVPLIGFVIVCVLGVGVWRLRRQVAA